MEIRRFWVKNYKSLRDVALDFPRKLTVVAGPSGSGKTALAEAFLLLSDAAWSRAPRREAPRGVSIGIEVVHGCAAVYEMHIDEAVQKVFEIHCPQVDVGTALMRADQLSSVVAAVLHDMFLRNAAVILGIDWKAVRSPQPPIKQERLLPDASNFVSYLYTVTKGNIPESLAESVRYVYPDVHGMWFEEKGRNLLLKLATSSGAELDRNRFRELRQRLTDEALSIAPHVVEALLKVVETHGFTDPLVVEIDKGELRFKPDLTPNDFRYNASTKRLEAFYYYYDTPQHVESLKALIKAAWRLGLGILVRIEPHHKKMPIPYDNLPAYYDVFNGHEIKMTAEELWGFVRVYGGLY